MITENLSTLKIHKLSQAQYERELAAGNIDETALYLTPDIADNGVKFYFPSLENGGSAGSSAIMTVGNKCVLFDCNSAANNDLVITYYNKLYQEGVFSNIDAIVISHYHYDHVENLASILDAFPHKNCLVYLPMNPDGYLVNADTELGWRDNVISTLTERNVGYIEVSEETNVGLSNSCNMTLFNSTVDDYLYYLENSTSYNDYSMCALIQTGDVYSMFPGDIEIKAQKRIADTRTLPRLIVYSIHHHGFENEDCPAYIDMIRPEYGIISTNHTRMVDGTTDSMIANYATENLYSTAYGNCEFVVCENGGAVVHGKEITQCGWSYNNFNLYVDNEYDGVIHDGTQEHPFTNINECIMFVNENRQTNFTINIKATSTIYPFLWLRNIPKRIVLQGYSDNSEYTKPIIDGAQIYSSDCVEFENLCFSGEGRDYRMIYIVASTLLMNECEIASVENGGDNYRSAIYCNKNAYVHMSNCSVRDCYYGVYSSKSSTVITDTISFSNVTRCYRLANLDLKIAGDDVLADTVTTYINGDIGDGTQYRITTRASDSNIGALIAKNSASTVSYPFYYNNGLCIAYGTAIYNIVTSDITDGTLSYDILPIVALEKGGTGATTAVQALDNLGTLNLLNITDDYHLISEGDDLNDYTTPGTYRCPSAATSATLSNMVEYKSSGFRLIVSALSSTNDSCFQLAFFNAGQPRFYFRHKRSEGMWTEWTRVMTNVLTTEEYGISLPSAGTKGRIFFKKV